MSITDKRLNDIQERLAAATKGPWAHHDDEGGVVNGPIYGTYISWESWPEDADFIAHAREDVPALLAEVERLRGELAKKREITDDMIERAALVDLNMGLKFRGLGPVKSLEEIKPILGEEGPYRLRSTMRAALIAVLGGDDA